MLLAKAGNKKEIAVSLAGFRRADLVESDAHYPAQRI